MPNSFSAAIESSIHYLRSARAQDELKRDPYWPKWDSPWWHMLLLHEMGETAQIPQEAVETYVSALDKMPLKIFPIKPEEMPPGVDPFRGSPCHCQLGNVYQVLAARGVDVDTELSWLRPWFLRYQMSDGGLTCDNDAYLVKNEVPSSMVGTIPCFEAVLLYTERPFTPEESAFLEKGAQFLMGRKLIHGSSTEHNKAERKSAEEWAKLCFPRYYFYDVLRGLNALLSWAGKTNRKIPRATVADAIALLETQAPDGQVRIGRRPWYGKNTLAPNAEGKWIKEPASQFALLDQTSRLGEISPFLTQNWQKAKRLMQEHLE